MIYTRFGSRVTGLIAFEVDTGAVTFVRDDGSQRKCHIMELKADGGVNEILEAAKSVEGVKERLELP